MKMVIGDRWTGNGERCEAVGCGNGRMVRHVGAGFH